MTWICHSFFLPALLAALLAAPSGSSLAAGAAEPARALAPIPPIPPDVDADARSRNLTLDVPGRPFDLAFYGNPAPTSTASARTLLTLIQRGSGTARIEQASALCFKKEGEACLPAGIVRLSPCRFRRIEPRGTAQVNVLVAGQNLPPGEYNGMVHVAITDQPAPIDIPLKLRVKDGPMVALLALGAGLLLSALFNRWTVERRLEIHGAKALIVALSWLFVLAVGWILLYVKSPTFGAEPSSYISLVLWGATTEALRGRALSSSPAPP